MTSDIEWTADTQWPTDSQRYNSVSCETKPFDKRLSSRRTGDVIE